MIYKSNFDGQWHKVNPDYRGFDAEQTRVRRELFNSGIFRVDWSGTDYHMCVKGYSIGAWSPGDTWRARMFIDSAFSTYYAMTRCK